jgi:hypothetical protein
MLKQIQDQYFAETFLTAFDYQVICNSAVKLNAILIGDQEMPTGFKPPDFAVITCDNRSHLELTEELLFMGHLIDPDERWEFYKAENFERPSKEELRHLKAIIIPSSHHSIKNKVPKDENIIKQFLKRGTGNDTGSQLDNESSVGGSEVGFDI